MLLSLETNQVVLRIRARKESDLVNSFQDAVQL